ncbi:MAG: TIGR03936 family radical SAM-associated protein [Clostridia bacterium]|nr:TIGR03936 family radical SAM-associated protein [Clostridia bacterium]
MSNYVLKYAKGDAVKYISHLDFMRTFSRAVRRSKLPMVYSQGFNPHPIMTVALPLSVGVTSEGEYMKIGFDGDFSPDEIIQRLNASLPDGLCILDVKKAEGKEMDFSKIDRAKYLVDIELKLDISFDIDEFLKNDELVVLKKSKSGEKEDNIRPYIYSMNVDKKEGKMVTISMCLAAGSIYNLKPDTVILAMEKYIDGFAVEFFSVHRLCLLAGQIQYM